jgi:hypothetical protein
VKSYKETTTQTDINLGIVNIGFTPLKPAEFMIIKIQQMAGQGIRNSATIAARTLQLRPPQVIRPPTTRMTGTFPNRR